MARTRTSLSRERLAAQAVTRPLPGPAEVVRRLLAVQAQDFGAASWAVSLRCGGDAGAVGGALARHELVRTWPMRGTLHLVAAEDARWMIELLTPRVLTSTARRRAQLELDDATLGRARDALEAALAGRTSTRAELMEVLEAAGVGTGGQRGYHVLFHLAQLAVLVQVGRDVFAAFDEVVPPSAPVPRDEALARLALRYVQGHGPATAHDLAWWSGLPLGDVRRGLAAVGGDLERTDEVPEPGVHLLPAFDELLLGYRDRTAILDPAHADRVCPGGNGVFRPMLLVGGEVVATWRARTTARAVRIEVEPFGAAPDPSAVEPAARVYAAYLGKALA